MGYKISTRPQRRTGTDRLYIHTPHVHRKQLGRTGSTGMAPKYFTPSELTKTEQDHPNRPGPKAEQNLLLFATQVLDPIREAHQAPIYVTSAYRSVAVNQAVGGVGNSFHLKGTAADIYAHGEDVTLLTGAELKAVVEQADIGVPLEEVIPKDTALHVAVKPSDLR